MRVFVTKSGRVIPPVKAAVSIVKVSDDGQEREGNKREISG